MSKLDNKIYANSQFVDSIAKNVSNHNAMFLFNLLFL